jgi:pimeloyl-ACP methyl ester carboxylesterase
VRRALAAGAALLLLLALPSGAEPGKPERTRPQGPAAWKFAKTVPVILDSEWKWKVGGFGGIRPRFPLRHVPVVFVHGNNVDAADWYPVRDQFRKAGWTDQELWALSYGGLGGSNGTALFTANPERDREHQEMGKDGTTYITENDVNVPDLARFIRMVQAYTGSRRFALVTHSLGVTLARRTLQVHRDLRRDLVAFVGIAGANHGTTFCPPGSEGNVVSCDEIAAGTAWLARLNAGGETYGPARWMTVYDGTGAGDPAYVGPAYAQSPRLEGALNKEFPNTYHNDLRLDPAIVAVYRAFVERYGTLRR